MDPIERTDPLVRRKAQRGPLEFELPCLGRLAGTWQAAYKDESRHSPLWQRVGRFVIDVWPSNVLRFCGGARRRPPPSQQHPRRRAAAPRPPAAASACGLHRSEERRVGKEGRSRWSPYHLKKKTPD